MHFGFALDSSDIDLLNIDLLDTHLDLLDRDIPVNNLSPRHLQDIFKTSYEMSSRRLQDVFARRRFVRYIFLDLLDRDIPVNNLFVSKTSSRRLQDMSSRRFEDVFSVTIFHLPRRLQNVLEDKKLLHWRSVEDVKLLHWRRVEDVFKTSWRPAIVCWIPFFRRTCIFSVGFKMKPRKKHPFIFSLFHDSPCVIYV